MPVTLTKQAVEKSTYVIDVAYADEEGASVAINSGGTWKLTNESGHVINSRQNQALVAAATATIVLTGDDLAIPSGREEELRVLTIEATYNSSAGNNLALREQVEFTVVNLTAVA